MSDERGSSGPAQRGRTRITPRAIDRIVSGVAAEAFGVERRAVSLDVDDADGGLSLRVRTPLRLPTLEQIADDPDVVARGGGPLVERTTAAQKTIRSRVESITGTTVARVLVEVTSAHLRKQRRVR